MDILLDQIYRELVLHNKKYVKVGEEEKFIQLYTDRLQITIEYRPYWGLKTLFPTTINYFDTIDGLLEPELENLTLMDIVSYF